jgi:hypothetical protein
MRELTAYVIDGHELRIRPAPLERAWMDSSNERFAYRCLPLNIANAHGWEILCTAGFAAYWNGSQALDAVRVLPDLNTTAPAVSHFGHGILTFHIPCLFKTDAGVDLFATGPINRPKDGIAPLTGVIETNWSPYTFTMNWQFTRPNMVVRFEADEPFCHIFPVARGELEAVDPVICDLSENPDLEHDYKLWSESRDDFNAGLKTPGSKAAEQRWQKTYFRGFTPSGKHGDNGHRSKLRLRPFKLKD